MYSKHIDIKFNFVLEATEEWFHDFSVLGYKTNRFKGLNNFYYFNRIKEFPLNKLSPFLLHCYSYLYHLRFRYCQFLLLQTVIYCLCVFMRRSKFANIISCQSAASARKLENIVDNVVKKCFSCFERNMKRNIYCLLMDK